MLLPLVLLVDENRGYLGNEVLQCAVPGDRLHGSCLLLHPLSVQHELPEEPLEAEGQFSAQYRSVLGQDYLLYNPESRKPGIVEQFEQRRDRSVWVVAKLFGKQPSIVEECSEEDK